MATLLFPLYIYPSRGGQAWEPLLQAVRGNSGAKVIAIVNPSNGPGEAANPDYTDAIDRLDSAGVRMAAYVFTRYGSRPIEEVERDMLGWTKLYPKVTRTFVDNMANRPGFEPYYAQVVGLARACGSSLVIGNPGAPIPESYSGTFDVTVIYENAGYPATPEALDPYGWYRLHPAQFGMIVHDASSLDAGFVRGATEFAEYICVTESYHAFPSYLDELLSVLG